LVEGKVIGIGNVAYCLGMSSKKLNRWYKETLSGYRQSLDDRSIFKNDLILSDPKYGGEYDRIRVAIFKKENMGKAMAIDEKQLDGVMYTILSNRETNKIALMADTLKTKHLATLIHSIGNEFGVRSYTRDMASNYDSLGRQVFMNAYHEIDKFHVIKSALENLQAIRVRYRQEELTQRREQGQDYQEEELTNGDTSLQLLSRSRGLLFKRKDEWKSRQKERASILFAKYPDLELAYQYITKLRKWYTINMITKDTRTYKKEKLDDWITTALSSGIRELKNTAGMITRNSGAILNYFIKKETNAKAEALNSRIQRFINVNYGARNRDYFLFRLEKQFS